MTTKKIIILVGPSGSGKTSIGQMLEKKSIPRLVTTTTRSARDGEFEGVDYYFRDYSEMKMDDFVEQTVYNENRYGLTKAEIQSMLEKYNIVHVSLDKQGAEALKKTYPNESFIVFVEITENEMIERMNKRGDSKKEIEERVAFAQKTKELLPPENVDLKIRNINIEDSAQMIIDHLTQKMNE